MVKTASAAGGSGLIPGGRTKGLQAMGRGQKQNHFFQRFKFL